MDQVLGSDEGLSNMLTVYGYVRSVHSYYTNKMQQNRFQMSVKQYPYDIAENSSNIFVEAMAMIQYSTISHSYVKGLINTAIEKLQDFKVGVAKHREH